VSGQRCDTDILDSGWWDYSGLLERKLFGRSVPMTAALTGRQRMIGFHRRLVRSPSYAKIRWHNPIGWNLPLPSDGSEG
jgi:hypothetical protein